MRSGASVQVFISHAHADSAVVEEFVRLLKEGVGLTDQDIFCSSSVAQGIPGGEDFKEFIRASLANAKLVFAIVSPAYLRSAFCMCELGGAWLTSKRCIPVLLPTVKPDELVGVLPGIQAVKAEARSLDSLVAVINHEIPGRTVSVPQWNSGCARFLQVVSTAPNSVEPARPTSSVPAPAQGLAYDELANLRRELDEVELPEGKRTLLDALRAAIPGRPYPKTPTALMDTLKDSGLAPGTVNFAFWWLTVLGVLRFNNIDRWWDGHGGRWEGSKAYVELAPRGRALLQELSSETSS